MGKTLTMASFQIICFLSFVTSFSNGNILPKLRNFDIIPSAELHTVTRRSVDGRETGSRDVQLTIHGRKLKLQLKKSHPPVADNLEVEVVHGDSTVDVWPMTTDHFFTGKVQGVNGSKVQAYFEDGSLTAFIKTPEEDLMVEPIWRHTGGQDRSTMIGYSSSDIIWDHNTTHSTGQGGSLCGAVHPDREHGIDEVSFGKFKPSDSGKHRSRRAALNKVCHILAVADYKFYRQIGGFSVYSTANYIVGIITRVNLIYTATNFGSGLTGIGFEINKLRINDAPTTSGGIHYNMENQADWDHLEFLNAFSEDLTLGDYCLAHLFTHQSFPSNVLGLAYIASDSYTDPGGICSVNGRTSSGVKLALNTAWSSMLDGGGSVLMTLQADLVTAHEFGHGFGSEHDPLDGDCSPGSIFGDGKYLMYPYSVTGDDPNNNIFSPCSIYSMKRVLDAKAGSCFVSPMEETPCGNGRIDDGEECDGGLLGKFDSDVCCTADCMLRGDAVCSPANYECCSDNCAVASSGSVCSTDVKGGCLESAHCNGFSLDCPAPGHKDNYTACTGDGSCLNGVCIAYCEIRELTSCACGEVATSCMKCCRDSEGRCSVHNSSLFLPDGRPCVQGYCEAGVCIKSSGSFVERFFEFLDEIDFDFLLETFRTNMVGCVMGFSLLIWLPVCAFIWYKDRKKKKHFEWEANVKIRTDRMLVYDQDMRLVQAPKIERQRKHRQSRRANHNSSRVKPVIETYTLNGERY